MDPTLQLARDLGVTGILGFVIFLIARLFEPLIKENIEARKAATKAREDATAMTERVAARWEQSDATLEKHARLLDGFLTSLGAFNESNQQRIVQNTLTQETVMETKGVLKQLPESIEQRLAAPESLTTQAHQRRTDKAVEDVRQSVSEGFTETNQRLDEINETLAEVRGELTRHGEAGEALAQKLDAAITLLKQAPPPVQTPIPTPEPPSDDAAKGEPPKPELDAPP